MSFSIRLTQEEKALVESYAKLHAISLSDAFKSALFDVAKDAYDEYLKSGKKSRPIGELWKELDI